MFGNTKVVELFDNPIKIKIVHKHIIILSINKNNVKQS